MASSSDDDSDHDPEEADRLRSVAIDSASITSAAMATASTSTSTSASHEAGPALKFYQSRARDLLYKYIDNTLEIKTPKYDDTHIIQHDEDSSGFYLFRCAPPGISNEHPHEDGLQKARKIDRVSKKIKIIDEDLDESSEKFRSCISAAAIDGMLVKANAKKAAAKAFSSFLSYQAKEKEAQRKEAERVALLKARQGERWLPSISKAMALEKVFEDKLFGEARSSQHKKQLGTYI